VKLKRLQCCGIVRPFRLVARFQHFRGACCFSVFTEKEKICVAVSHKWHWAHVSAHCYQLDIFWWLMWGTTAPVQFTETCLFRVSRWWLWRPLSSAMWCPIVWWKTSCLHFRVRSFHPARNKQWLNLFACLIFFDPWGEVSMFLLKVFYLSA
jgi:hypothetical protein